MGDVAMTVPVVYSLAKQYPDLRITFLSRSFARPFYENLAPNIRFMEADLKDEYKGIHGLNSLYRRLAAKNFTAIADLHDVLRSAYLRMRFNVNRYKVAHIDKHRNRRKLLTADKNKRLEQLPTAFENYAQVFAELGYPVNIDFKSIFPTNKGNLRLLPKEIGERKNFQEWIGIAPFAAHKGKIYPIEKIGKVTEMLLQKHPNCRIFFFGKGEKEEQVIDGITSNHPRCTNVSRFLHSLKEELILMSHLDVMLSMDSSNMHFASLVNTPVVSIWGATHPYAGFLGWNQSMDNVVQIDMECRPCSIFGNKDCKRNDWLCIRNIKPEAVVEKIEKVLRK